MSAAEKLKALTLTATPDVTVEVPIRLVHVLLQLVAVVEAAERLVDPILEPRAHVDEALVLDAALSALDEALGDVT